MKLTAFGGTDVGQVREKNEDAFLIDESRRLFLVADGMGGHAGGGFASSHAAAAVLEDLKRQEEHQDMTQPLKDDPGRTLTQLQLQHALRYTNEVLFQRSIADSQLRGMGTTLTAIKFDDRYANLAQVGDSRAYLIRESRLRQLTEDHSWVQEQVRSGVLTPEEARLHPLKNIITRSMGHEREVQVDLFKEEYRTGDRYLICSDGLTNMVEDAEILQTVLENAPQPAVERLIKRAKEEGGLDNVTVVVVAVEE
jgi:PPM family protein phosphatase